MSTYENLTIVGLNDCLNENSPASNYNNSIILNPYIPPEASEKEKRIF